MLRQWRWSFKERKATFWVTFLTPSPSCGIVNSLFTEPLVWCRERGRHMRGDGRLSLPLHLFARLTRIFYTAPCMKYSLANRISILSPFAYNNMIVIAWHHPGNWWGYCATWPIASPPPPPPSRVEAHVEPKHQLFIIIRLCYSLRKGLNF